MLYKYFVNAVRVSGGHLCEAEAPTEPACETAARRAAIRSKSPVIAKPCKRLWQSVFLFKGITDSFTLRTQNDKSFSHCKYIRRAAIRSKSPVIASTVRCVAIRFSFKGITDSFTLRTQNDKSFSHCKYIRRAAIRSKSPVIASTVRCVAIRFSF